jgi:aerobic-type carbon monoxide dehydrogenase small subunit (CoxS/CutS family)
MSITVPVKLIVNGQAHSIDASPHHTLLEVLRDQIGLTGTKECCAEGECGACTIILDGEAVDSCLMLAVEADGKAVLTIEGLATGDRLDPIQQAFLDHGAVQCGFCIPGMIMSAKYLLMSNPKPTEAEIKEGLAGNLCRCAGYSRIIAAVKAAAETMGSVPVDKRIPATDGAGEAALRDDGSGRGESHRRAGGKPPRTH